MSGDISAIMAKVNEPNADHPDHSPPGYKPLAVSEDLDDAAHLVTPIGRTHRSTPNHLPQVYEEGSMEVFDGEPVAEFQEMEKDEEHREGWDNKIQFLLSVISYAVGLGNIWRFPYLCQQNGGGAFLIPYCIMMVIEGMPLFLIEMGIGQKMRQGPINVWNMIHPYLGGVGVSSAVVSFLVGLYYNVIITWCLFYLFNSFQDPLPWKDCPVESQVFDSLRNTTIDVRNMECENSSETAFYWYRVAIETTDSIGDFGGINWRMCLCLIAAWFIVWVCVMKGIKTSGKVMYVTATFPYIVTTAFFIRSVTLPGADKGVMYMITPQMHRLKDPRVWLDAATQIFYSLGLAFGGLIAFASYMPPKNNVKRDVLILSGTNIVTSFYSAVVIFCILGYKGHLNYERCVKRIAEDIMHNVHYYDIVNQAIPGIGTAENLTTIGDGAFSKWQENFTILCGFSCLVGLIFVTRAGEYWVKLFDAFAGSYALMAVAFFEVIAVVYVYGWQRFKRDLEHMTGQTIGLYWLITWRFIAPLMMAVLFVSSLVISLMDQPKYHAYIKGSAHTVETPYPAWCLIIAGLIIFSAMAPVPFVFFVRYFKIWPAETSIPTAVKQLDSSLSTQRMLRSEQSMRGLGSADSVTQSNGRIA